MPKLIKYSVEVLVEDGTPVDHSLKTQIADYFERPSVGEFPIANRDLNANVKCMAIMENVYEREDGRIVEEDTQGIRQG